MSGRMEIIATHYPRQIRNQNQYGIQCVGCTTIWNGQNAWAGFGRHIDALLAKPPKDAKEAIINVLADHLGSPLEGCDWCLDITVSDHGRIECGCGWESDKPDVREWRDHMAEAILDELKKTEK